MKVEIAKNKKLLRLVALIAIIIVVIIIIVNVTKGDKNGEKEPSQSGLSQETMTISGDKLAEVKNYKGLQVSNVKFQINDKMTFLTADVYNATSTDVQGQYININVLDKDGNIIKSIGGYIDPVKAGETTPISSSIPSGAGDTEAYNIEITEQRTTISEENQSDSEA